MTIDTIIPTKCEANFESFWLAHSSRSTCLKMIISSIEEPVLWRIIFKKVSYLFSLLIYVRTFCTYWNDTDGLIEVNHC